MKDLREARGHQADSRSRHGDEGVGQHVNAAIFHGGDGGEGLPFGLDFALPRFADVLARSRLDDDVRRDPDDPDSLVASLSEADIHRMIADGTISAGMLPKVQACLRALDAGVAQTHIVDGRLPHSLLLEIFTEQGIGTLIQK